MILDRIMVALPDRPSMSAEEYLAWEPTQEERYEYWDGEVVAMSGQSRHRLDVIDTTIACIL
ncbi:MULTISPECIES: hypothetical protein [unclassified Microcoleus]